jgi:hypothetical protein
MQTKTAESVICWEEGTTIPATQQSLTRCQLELSVYELVSSHGRLFFRPKFGTVVNLRWTVHTRLAVPVLLPDTPSSPHLQLIYQSAS